MSLSNVFSIAGSAMNAQSVRLNTTASNLANAESISSSSGETYRARKPVFEVRPLENAESFLTPGVEAGAGVQVAGVLESQASLRQEYSPSHPLADENGFIYYPNVNVVEEMADMISASRSFQINAEIMNTAKQMLQRTLSLGQ
ncbi:flagellar basal body rod protein FlgC [Marinobacterium rhizophilum]|uniref:flagellar basal body rod protein FlgC n=1 Tax=Marinobacterium rhizophilum TaxID=420402 RepID=UPI000372F8EE|nr:flagellar basal body rod protein FlgC [Marinobacterium rhizophilum]